MNNTYYLVRHGATVFNEQGRFIGTRDVPLSQRGVHQALVLRESIKGMYFDVAYSSPLLRAQDTAKLVLGKVIPLFNEDWTYELILCNNGEITYNIPLIIDSRLSERSFGDLAGEIKEGYTERFPKYKGRNVTKSFDDRPDGGENFADLERKLVPFYDECGEKYEDKRIFISSHNGPLRESIKILEGLSEEKTLALDNPYCQLMEYLK